MKKIISLFLILSPFYYISAQWHNDYLSHHEYKSEALKKNPKEKWVFNAEGTIYGPAIKKGTAIFFGDTKGYLYAVDSNNGKLNWKFKTEGKVLGCPSIKDAYVYFGAYDGYLYCLNSKNGKLVWKFKTGSGASCSPPLIKGNKVYFGSHDNYYYVVNRFTGNLLQKKEIGHGNCSTSSYENGLLYLADWSGTIHCLASDNLKSKWHFKTDYKVYQTPVIDRNQILVASFDSIVYALDKKTGNLNWKKKLNSVANQVGIKNNIAFFNTRASDLYAVDKNTGMPLWEFTTEGATWGFAICAEDVIYFGSGDNTLYAINLYTGTKIWEYNVDKTVQRAAIYDKVIYFPSSNKLYAIY